MLRRSTGLRALPVCVFVLLVASPRPWARAAEPAARQLLAVQACGAEAAARAAEVAVDAAGAARVWCPSIERVANHAIRLRSECRGDGSQWRCEPLGKEFELEVNGRRASVLYPVTLDSWAAYQMARSIAPLAIAVAKDERTRRPERCQLSGEHTDLKIARMTLRCLDWTVEFVRLCDSSGCRHEPASRISNARPKPRTR